MTSDEKKSFSRLPTNVVPVNYDLKLTPYLETFKFDGDVNVELQIKEPTSTLVMNCAEIEICSAKFTNSKGNSFEPSNVELCEETETLSLHFAEKCQPGTGQLSINFKGELNGKMKGFYRSKYEKDGVVKYAATTQFESTDARRCFPCWDEPALKSTFDCTLVVPKELVALSNMNVIDETPCASDASKKVMKYAQTPIMSTYLLAFVVGEFDFVESHSSNGVNIKVYTRVGKKEQGRHALEVAVNCLDFFENYFGIPYPLNKLDLIAIADFASGAMENWGLITYREPAVLVDAKNTSSMQKQYVAIVVCHEIAHQWFGNLVTMEWWTHLWLNEGFASFMEYLATDNYNKSYMVWDQFITDNHITGLSADALENSHPIEVEVGHPDEVDEIFDNISYQKGGSIIRMLNKWIGPENFRTGLHNYLKKFSYKNALTEDLWAALGEASGQPVQEVMSTWTVQMGFPVLDVNIKSSTDNSVTLSISQKKFCASMCPNSENVSEALWSVPVSFSTSGNPDGPYQTYLLTTRSAEVVVDKVPANGWIKLNPGFVGSYRVNYSPQLLSRLLPAIKSQDLSVVDRLHVQNDVFAMASSGVVSMVEYLKMLEAAYSDEVNYPILSDVASNLTTIKYVTWNDEECSKLFKQFTNKLFTNAAETLGWTPKEGEDHLTGMLRPIAILKCGSADIMKESTRKFLAFKKGSEPLLADLRGAVYRNYISQGGVAALEELLKMHEASDLQEEQNRIERSIGSVVEPQAMDAVLKFAFSDKVRDSERVFILGSLARSTKLGCEKSWKYVKDNWKQYEEIHKGSYLFGRGIRYATEHFASEESRKEVENFFTAHDGSSAERTIKQSLESIELNAKLWNRDGQYIKTFLKNSGN